MNTIINDIKSQFKRGNAVTQLIMLNVAIYLLIHLIAVPVFLINSNSDSYYSFIQNWFYLPSDPIKLLTRPWTLITYMFLHSSFWHILFNMLVLYWFGRITNDLISNTKIVPIYLLGGITGALLFMLTFNTIPIFAKLGSVPLVGASASVMAILLAAATLNPKGQIRMFLIGTIELQYIALALIVLDIISIRFSNPGGHFAHLGGALMGWLYIHQLRRGRNLGLVFEQFMSWATGQQRSAPRKKREPRMAYKKAHQSSSSRAEGQSSSNSATYGFSRSFAQKYRNMSQQECVDAILDKIRKSGYNSLSEEEKSFLDKTSKK